LPIGACDSSLHQQRTAGREPLELDREIRSKMWLTCGRLNWPIVERRSFFRVWIDRRSRD